MSRNESVDALRKKIDQIDEKLVSLLNVRASLARKIGRTKSLNHQEIYAPAREKEIFRRLGLLNRGPLPDEALRSIYREVISASRALEAPLRVAYLGPEATYSHAAARERFGTSAALVAAPSIDAVFQEVVQERASFGVVPIENSTEGVVGQTLDQLVEADVNICAELFVVIHHCLLSRTGRADRIRRIASHPQALAQCRGWLARRFPRAKLEEVASTAQAALMAKEDGSLGAVCSALARDVYGLEIVAANIEDRSNNITRFVVIGKIEPRPTGDDKTSLVFSVKDEPGILHRMLEPLARNRINLTKIESRPMKDKPWEYRFFIDFKGHKDEPRVKRALRILDRGCTTLKILGSYPAGT
ncbi:MAG TPA: prephenate dehydratase [candidate division Zixibacteria bacterium]|nr:prephenate dehydratase [candidate division Zixibacteria bacterium]